MEIFHINSPATHLVCSLRINYKNNTIETFFNKSDSLLALSIFDTITNMIPTEAHNGLKINNVPFTFPTIKAPDEEILTWFEKISKNIHLNQNHIQISIKELEDNWAFNYLKQTCIFTQSFDNDFSELNKELARWTDKNPINPTT